MRTKFDWWNPEAKHWYGRTMAIVGALGVLVALVASIFQLLDRTEPGMPRIPREVSGEADTLQSAPPSQADEKSSKSCSGDSEGKATVGWGPDRPIFYDDTYPNFLTFNSTGFNANIGDERNFVGIRPISSPNSEKWSDRVEVQNGELYRVRIYVRLDGPSSHHSEKTKLMVNLPNCTAHRIGVGAFINSLNAFPQQVYDGAEFWSRRNFNLYLMPDSGMVNGNFYPDGEYISLNDLVTQTGISLGSKKLDGNFYPGYENSVYVTFIVKAQVASD